MYRILKVQY